MKRVDTDTVVAVLLSRVAAPGTHRAMIRGLRRHATVRLADACAALGITQADLEDNDRAVVACLMLQKARGKRSDRQAAALLRWCVQADEHGVDDAIVVRILQARRGLDAAVQGDQQAARRKGKPATVDGGDEDRNARIQHRHARLVGLNHPSPTDATAIEFGLSRRTVQRILKDPPG